MKLKALNVSQVNNYIKRILQSDPVLTNISVKGEVSNIKYHENGHVYLTLKDSTSKLNCFISFENNRYLKYELENGMEITVSGYISVYEKYGSYSLNVLDIIVEGKGNLHIAFEKLKEKLKKEGLFDASQKKELPFFPKSVAIVTSASGAAIKDILMTIKKKNYYVNIYVFPCLVQGNYASKDISGVLEHINKHYPDIDIIILGRGGGSMEELWPFNEEIVARSIHASTIPVISAVGHETDFSISDFAADVRAATPTAAADIAVPNLFELSRNMKKVKKDLNTIMYQIIEERRNKLQKHNFEVITSLLKHQIRNLQLYCNQYHNDIYTVLREKMNHYKNEIEKRFAVLEHLNPEHILKRGFAALINKNDSFVKSIEDVDIGDDVTIVLADGDLSGRIINKKHKDCLNNKNPVEKERKNDG